MSSIFSRCLNIFVLFSYLNLVMTSAFALGSVWETTDYKISVKRRTEQLEDQGIAFKQEGLRVKLKQKNEDTTVGIQNYKTLFTTFISDREKPLSASQTVDFTEQFNGSKQSIGFTWHHPLLSGLSLMVLWDGSLLMKGSLTSSLTLASSGTVALQDVDLPSAQFTADQVEIGQNAKLKTVKLRLREQGSVAHILEDGALLAQDVHLLKGMIFNQGLIKAIAQDHHLHLNGHHFTNAGTLEAAGQSTINDAGYMHHSGHIKATVARIKAEHLDHKSGKIEAPTTLIETKQLDSAREAVIDATNLTLQVKRGSLSGNYTSTGAQTLEVSGEVHIAPGAAFNTPNLIVKGSGTVANDRELLLPGRLSFADFRGTFINNKPLQVAQQIQGFCHKLMNYDLLQSLGGYNLKIHELLNAPQGRIEGNDQITAYNGQNRGFMGDNTFIFNVGEKFKNLGTLKFKELSGLGLFKNRGVLIGASTDGKAAKVNVAGFHNKKYKDLADTGVVLSAALEFTRLVKKWCHESGVIDVKKLKFSLSNENKPFVNKALIQSSESLIMSGGHFINESEIFAHNFITTLNNFENKETGHIQIQNDLVLVMTLLFKNSGKVVALGKSVGIKVLEFISTGQMLFKGKAAFEQTHVVNEGNTWFEDEVKVARLTNKKHLKSLKSITAIDWINSGIADIQGGFLVYGNFDNTGTINFLTAGIAAGQETWTNNGSIFFINLITLLGLKHLINNNLVSIEGRGFSLAHLTNNKRVEIDNSAVQLEQLDNHGTIALFGKPWSITQATDKPQPNVLAVRRFNNPGDIFADDKLSYNHNAPHGKLAARNTLHFIQRDAALTPQDLADLSVGEKGLLEVDAKDFEVHQNAEFDIPALTLNLSNRLLTLALFKVNGDLNLNLPGQHIYGLTKNYRHGRLEAKTITLTGIYQRKLLSEVTPPLRFPNKVLTANDLRRIDLKNGALIEAKGLQVTQALSLKTPFLIFRLSHDMDIQADFHVQGAFEAYAQGQFKGGVSNERMGRLRTGIPAAPNETEAQKQAREAQPRPPLTVEAANVDLSFGKVFGSGSTLVQATKGDVKL